MWMRKICLRIKTPNRWSKGKRTNGSRWGFNLTVFSCWLTFSGNGKKEKGLQDLWLCFLPLSRMGVQAKTLQVNILFRLRKILCLTNKCSKDIDIFLDSRTGLTFWWTTACLKNLCWRRGSTDSVSIGNQNMTLSHVPSLLLHSQHFGLIADFLSLVSPRTSNIK